MVLELFWSACGDHGKLFEYSLGALGDALVLSHTAWGLGSTCVHLVLPHTPALSAANPAVSESRIYVFRHCSYYKYPLDSRDLVNTGSNLRQHGQVPPMPIHPYVLLSALGSSCVKLVSVSHLVPTQKGSRPVPEGLSRCMVTCATMKKSLSLSLTKHNCASRWLSGSPRQLLRQAAASNLEAVNCSSKCAACSFRNFRRPNTLTLCQRLNSMGLYASQNGSQHICRSPLANSVAVRLEVAMHSLAGHHLPTQGLGKAAVK